MARFDEDTALLGLLLFNLDAMLGTNRSMPLEDQRVGGVRLNRCPAVQEAPRGAGGPHRGMVLDDLQSQSMEGTMSSPIATSLSYMRRKNVQHEARLQKSIIEFLHAHGVFAWINYQPLIRKGQMKLYHTSSTGVSDILAIFEGKPVAIEVKHGNNKPTKKQEEFLQKFRDEGGIAFVARSLEDVCEGLGRLSWMKGIC